MRVNSLVLHGVRESCNYMCVGVFGLLLLLGACSDGAAPGGNASSDADTPTDAGGDLLITAGDDGVADGDVEEIAPPEYFEKPCTSNDQCVDDDHPDDPYGYCVEFNKDGEKKCTTSCTIECPEGYGCVGIQNPGGSDGLFVCMPELSTNCNSCESDEDCIYEGARCIEVGSVGGEVDMRCAQDCSKTSGQCSDGYICQVFPQASSADEIQLCVPSTGSCICFGQDDDGVDIDGSKRDCEKSNEYGTCKGLETCAGEKGWSACDAQDPAEEICDGLDNNCDAKTDENLEDKPCSESNDFGTCEGIQSCDSENGYVCDALIPVEELCDGKDNNCNGETDEGFDDTDGDKTADCVDDDCDDDGVLDADDNCVCTVNKDQLDTDKNGFGDACDDDFDGDTVPNDKDNCPLTSNTDQTNTDLDLANGDSKGDACDTDDDGDLDPDVSDCAPLNPAINNSAEEICDNLDNNCNLVIDEGFADSDSDDLADCVDPDDDNDGDPDECVADDAECKADCAPTDPLINSQADEICDGLDNNCDGNVDEGFDDTDEDEIADCVDPDKDNDGVENADDNCELVLNADQANHDDDTSGDACDTDDDNDTVLDDDDNCPIVANTDQTDLDEDLIGNACDPDKDGDTVNEADGDCNDLDDEVFPDADELCDGKDNNCNITIDEGFPDSDVDDLADCVDDNDDNDVDLDDVDCAPTDPLINSEAEELCDGIDNNCNSAIDEACPPTNVDLIFVSATVSGALEDGNQLQLSIGLPGVVGQSAPAAGDGFSVDWGFYYTLP